MGTPVDPDFPEFGNDCGCFPPGETPGYVTMIVSGFQQADLPGCAGTPMPNGQFHLGQVPGSPCGFVTTKGFFQYQFSFSTLHGSAVTINETITGHILLKETGEQCKGGMYADPGAFKWPCWICGGASVSWGGGAGSLRQIAQIAGIPLDDQLNSDMFCKNDYQGHMLYVSHYSRTKIRFKLDMSHLDQYLDLEA